MSYTDIGDDEMNFILGTWTKLIGGDSILVMTKI